MFKEVIEVLLYFYIDESALVSEVPYTSLIKFEHLSFVGQWTHGYF